MTNLERIITYGENVTLTGMEKWKVIGDIAGSLACYVKKEKNKKERTKRKKNKVC